jgi:carboxypeptidase Taq
MSEKLEQAKAILGEVASLDRVLAMLAWDREALMPPGGNDDRTNQIGLLTRLQYERATSAELGRLLEDLAGDGSDLDPDGHDGRLARVAKRDYDQICRLPEKLVLEIAEATSAAIPVWREAREASDFARYKPFLERNVDLNRQRAEALGYEGRIYDPLIDVTEPGMTTDQLETIFGELREAIVPLVKEISARADAVDDSLLHQHYDPDTQMQFSLEIAKQLGYDTNRGRLDLSPHPFCTSFGLGDVRITTRVWPHFLNACLFAVMHESGHAMYEQGASPDLWGGSAFNGTSAGVHESQSRLWENLVGRGRSFTHFLFPRLQETYPQQLGGATEEEFYRAINKVQPSYIRVEADEVTYNLHIMLRFELENALLERRLEVADLEEAWNEKFNEYLGITPDTAANGVLQDIHWSGANSFGVFPGYTLGNIIGAQLFAQVHKEMPDLDEQLSRGECGNLLGWLREKVYRHGRKYNANELMERITGEPVGTRAWITYAQKKFGELYGI